MKNPDLRFTPDSTAGMSTETKEHFQANETVNHIEIDVHWDDTYNDYVVLFPDEPSDRQLQRISQNPGDAERVFYLAVTMARSARSANDLPLIRKKIFEFAKEFWD